MTARISLIQGKRALIERPYRLRAVALALLGPRLAVHRRSGTQLAETDPAYD
jgi:hypothetical protein